MSNEDKINAFFDKIKSTVDTGYEYAYGALDSAMVEVDKFIDRWHKESLAKAGVDKDIPDVDIQSKTADLINHFKAQGFDLLVKRIEEGHFGRDDIERAWETLSENVKTFKKRDPNSPL